MINKLCLTTFVSKNKVRSLFYPTTGYKNPQNFQTSQILLISLYFTKIFNLKWDFSQSFLGSLKNISGIRHTESQSIIGKLEVWFWKFCELLIPENNANLPTGRAKIHIFH